MDEPENPGLSFWDIKDPRSVLGQTRAVALMRSDKRASYKHFALLEFHWGWAHQKYNHTSLASVRTIHATLLARDPLGKAPISLNHINSANLDLVRWGWLFEIDKGSGRSGSRFIPNYAIFRVAADGDFQSFLNGDIKFSVHPAGEHTGFCISVHPMGDTSVTYEVNTNLFSVHLQGDKDSLTGTVLKDGSTEREIDCAPATPPLSDGLEATDAGSAQMNGFEELWKAYGHRQRKAEARSAYERLAPDSGAHARMVDAAKTWQASWAAQGKADAPRFTLAKWIERQEYDCEPPTAYKPKERKAKAEAPRKASNDNESSDRDAPDFTVHADEPAGGTIERVEDWTDPDDGAKALTIYYRTHRGEEIEQFFVYESDNEREQQDGQEELRTVLDAVSLDGIDSAEELIGRKVDLMINNGKFVSCSKPWVPAPKEPRVPVRFADVVKNTPFGGWSKMIGTAPMDEDAA